MVVFTGTAGDDQLGPLNGGDSANGLAGNDTIEFVGGTNGLIDGGTGTDLIDTVNYTTTGINITYSAAGSGSAASSFFTFQNIEQLLLTINNDTVTGSGGAEDIQAGEGNDSVLGGSGNDSILGQAGNDTLRGDAGNDSIYGGFDNDSLYGGAGDDLIDGDLDGSGSALITTNLVARLDASDTSSITTHPGSVTLWNDISGMSLVNNGIVDQNNAESGSVTINGLNALEFDGTDIIGIADSTDINIGASTKRSNFVSFETGADVTTRQVIFEEGAQVNGLSFYIDGGSLYAGAWNAGDFIIFLEYENITANTVYTAGFQFDWGGSNEFVGYVNGAEFGSATLTADLPSHSGDIGIGGQNNGSYYHDTGGDTASAKYEFTGKIGELLLYQGSIAPLDARQIQNFLIEKWHSITADDYIEGGDGDDTLLGALGNDTLLGGNDNDSIDGGVGNDSIVGGDGNNTIIGGAGADTITANDGDDSITGGDGADSIVGGNGLNTLEGGDGNDSITGGIDADSIDGGAGIETLLGGTGDDTLDGGADNDSLHGGQNNDSLIGGAGDDTIYGDMGNDIIDTGTGAADVIYQTVEAGSTDTILNFRTNDATAVVDLTDFVIPSFSRLDFTQMGADTHLDLGNGQTLIFDNVTVASLSALDFTGFNPGTAGSSMNGTSNATLTGRVIQTLDLNDFEVFDWNGDGVMDIVSYGGTLGAGWNWYSGADQSTNAISAINYGTSDNWTIIDYNTDGVGDIVTDFFGDLRVYYGGGGSPTILDAGPFVAYSVGDFDNNGSNEFQVFPVALGFPIGATDEELLEFVINSGNSYNIGSAYGLYHLGDADNDGTQEAYIVTGGYVDNVMRTGVWRWNDDSTFSQIMTTSATRVISEDWDNDGVDDILVVGGGFSAGLDQLIYGADDVIVGTANNDTLAGGNQNDTLTGGLGNDTFAFTTDVGNNEITDFGTGFNTLQFTGVTGITTAADVIANSAIVGSDTVITIAGEGTITLLGFTSLDLNDIIV